MSDSVVPTQSEKPMCKHGFDRWHDFEIYDGGQTPGESPDFRGRCPGPVIATPEKWCLHSPEDSCDGDCMAVATEPETPVPDATEQMIPESLVAELLADAAQRYCPELERVEAEAYAHTRWVHDPRLRQLPASDPTPDLRERIGWALAQWIAEVSCSDDSDRFDANRGVELVLAALGEPRARPCPECAGASRDGNGNESRFPCGTCSAALKGEPK